MAGQESVRQGLSHFTKIEDLWERNPDLRSLPAFAAVATAVATATPITRRVMEPESACPIPASGARLFRRSSEALHSILEEVSGNSQIEMLDAYHQTVCRKGKDYAVEVLMQDCLDFLCEVAPKSDMDALSEAQNALKGITSPVQDVSTNTWNHNSGSGTQIVMSGRGNQNVNTGTGAQYNGLVNQYSRP